MSDWDLLIWDVDSWDGDAIRIVVPLEDDIRRTIQAVENAY